MARACGDDRHGRLYEGVWQNGRAHEAVRRDLRSCTHRNGAYERTPGSDMDVTLYCRGTGGPAFWIDPHAQRYILKENHAAPDVGRPADGKSHPVNDNDPRIDLGLPVDVGSVCVANHTRRNLRSQRDTRICAEAHRAARREHLKADAGDEIAREASLLSRSAWILRIVVAEHRMVFPHGVDHDTERTDHSQGFSPSRSVRTHSGSLERDERRESTTFQIM
jgi:hypothetical protein